jgi:uncharacterized protein
MQAQPDQTAESYQTRFHRRWQGLNDPHVRTLAWLLDAPDLLDAHAVQWQGKVASLGAVSAQTEAWLFELDRAPLVLQEYVGVHPQTRLGRYAEKLMAFYLDYCGRLAAHGVQVRADKGETIGEFDFLVNGSAGLLHWEFATKLYLLEPSGTGLHADYFVGPNLADTLGIKIRKIMDQQLSLSRHPAALRHLPEPVVAAQALVKGWLFYHGQTPLQPPGIARAHCRGFWCTVEELDCVSSVRAIPLPRLTWLAPVKARAEQTMSIEAVKQHLRAEFEDGAAPVLVSLVVEKEGMWLEVDRGFVVPDDWRRRAERRLTGIS